MATITADKLRDSLADVIEKEGASEAFVLLLGALEDAGEHELFNALHTFMLENDLLEDTDDDDDGYGDEDEDDDGDGTGEDDDDN
ncbi:MAG: hypothetical protein MN733_15450 [Nitrososphaera sp.]|nr:hypothetical protein [Nitrososphaera sp.]